MSPDRFPRIDASLVWLDSVDSTNALAGRLLAHWQAAEEGELLDTLIAAGEQRQGRGRGGNRWESPAGGVYATWLSAVPRQALGVVPLAAGVALAEAVEAVLGDTKVAIKWPNDLIIGGAKLAGILCQSRTIGAHAAVVVGFGVNVAPLNPDTLAIPPLSLSELGYRGTAFDALAGLVGAFVPAMRGFLDVPQEALARWAERSIHRSGDVVRFRSPEGEVEGAFRGFAADGALVLEVGGVEQRFAAGELVAPLESQGG